MERETSKSFSADLLTLDQVPGLEQEVTASAWGDGIAWGRSSEQAPTFWVDPHPIVKVTDSTGNYTYSLRLRSEEELPNVVYNLVTTDRSDGVPIAPFVIRYELADGDLAGYTAQQDRRFRGRITVHSLSALSEILGLEDAYRHPSAPPCYDDVDQETLVVVGDSSDGASTGSGSWGSSQTGSYSGWSSQGTVSFSIGNEGNSTTGGPKGTVEVGQGCFCETLTNEEETDRGSERPNDCPKGELLVPVNILDELPPDCASFDFQTSTVDAYWQEAAVEGIHFKIVLIDHSGIRITHTISFDQAILFGMPTNMVTGGDISPGLAAEISAMALKVSMDETVDLYGGTDTSVYTVKQYFRERLIENYEHMTNGGRAQFNAMNYSVTPTQYKVTWFGIGDCD